LLLWVPIWQNKQTEENDPFPRLCVCPPHPSS
jgi:hypothetical protein